MARALELLERWGGAKQDKSRPTGVPQVRMAFSGKREPADGEAANRRPLRRRRGSESQDKDS